MSSSMRNAIQRRSHRERAQPLERQRLGLLEKHKDYRLRAKDWAKKKATLKSLREKAADRNEDEFSYKMLSRGKGPGSALTHGGSNFDQKGRSKNWTGTVNGDRGGRSLSVDEARLLKTQDAGYLRTVRNVAAKEVARLEERVAVARSFVGAASLEDDDDVDMDDEDEDDEEAARPKKKARKPAAKKIVFAETASDRDAALEDQLEAEEDDDDDDNLDENTPQARRAEVTAKLQRRLARARARLRALDAAERELDLQRARMAKTATVDRVTRTGRRIKMRERKR